MKTAFFIIGIAMKIKKNELLDNLDCNESKLTVLQKFYNETKDLFNLLKDNSYKGKADGFNEITIKLGKKIK